MSEGPNPYDELTALFVTEPDETARGATAAMIEMVVVGNLPVRASLWLPPYADALAREAGPTALLRLDNEVPFLQLLRAPETLATQRWPTLVDAIADLGPHIGTWVVRPPLDVSPGDVSTCGCDRITILCSVNDSAIVDAYQRSKAIVDGARDRGAEPPDLGVAVLGSDRHSAVRMQQQLSKTTDSYLGVSLSMVACVQQMDERVRASDCLTFPADDHPSLPTVVMWIREAMSKQAAPLAESARPPLPEAAPPAETGPTVKLAPKPTVELEPKGPARGQEPDQEGRPVPLTGYIDGIAVLDVRCPGHERLEVGVDQAGRLHVAAREADIRELHVVETWARAHHELIARACPDHWFDPKVPTVLHVFTGRPSTVTDLYGSELRLHVLAPVPGEGPPRWYYAPLNTPVT